MGVSRLKLNELIKNFGTATHLAFTLTNVTKNIQKGEVKILGLVTKVLDSTKSVPTASPIAQTPGPEVRVEVDIRPPTASASPDIGADIPQPTVAAVETNMLSNTAGVVGAKAPEDCCSTMGLGFLFSSTWSNNQAIETPQDADAVRAKAQEEAAQDEAARTIQRKIKDARLATERRSAENKQKMQAAHEAQLKAEREAAALKEAEEKAKLLHDEAKEKQLHEARLKAEEEARIQQQRQAALELEKAKSEAEEAARVKAEEEASKKRAEDAARTKATEEEAKKLSLQSPPATPSKGDDTSTPKTPTESSEPVTPSSLSPSKSIRRNIRKSFASSNSLSVREASNSVLALLDVLSPNVKCRVS